MKSKVETANPLTRGANDTVEGGGESSEHKDTNHPFNVMVAGSKERTKFDRKYLGESASLSEQKRDKSDIHGSRRTFQPVSSRNLIVAEPEESENSERQRRGTVGQFEVSNLFSHGVQSQNQEGQESHNRERSASRTSRVKKLLTFGSKQ